MERWGLDRIKEYPKNARVHSEQQVAQISESMLTFGVTTPVLVDEEGVLIYGHGRHRGAELCSCLSGLNIPVFHTRPAVEKWA